MKHFKITDYKTSDWFRQFSALLVICLLGRLLFTSVISGHYAYAAGHALGLAGWFMVYLRMMRTLRERNPQN
ncbi:MAG: hypothetical protein ACI4B5_00305 [Bacteroidaceae bacterium]